MLPTAFAKRFGKNNIAPPPLVTEYLTAAELTHDWANLTGWSSAGIQVSANRLYGIAGANPSAAGKAFAVAAGATVKVTAEIQRVSGDTRSQYVGVCFGGTSDGVNASLPTFAGIGIVDAGNKPGYYTGASFAGVTDASIDISAENLGSGTYRAIVTVDAEQISMVLRRQDGTKEWSASIPRANAPNGGVISSVLVWNSDTRGTGGSYIKAIGVKASLTPFRTQSNAAGTIEGNTSFVVQRNDTDAWRIQLPKVLNPLVPAPIAVYFHQAGSNGTKDAPMEDSRWVSLRQALEDNGYILVSCDDGGHRWGNAASVANYADLVSWVQGKVYCGKVFLIGCSMGGLPMWNTIRHRAMYPIGAAVALSPVCDLIPMRANSAFTADIDAAYGSSSEATLVANSVGYNPVSETGDKFRRIPYLINIGTSDTTVPEDDHTYVMEPIIAPYAVSTEVNEIGTGHLQAALFDPVIILPFFNSHLGLDDIDLHWYGVVSLLHFDGSDTSTVFTDQKGKVWAANGAAQLDTAQSKFGTASLRLDGTGDYITTPNHVDFQVAGGDFTIEAWVRLNELGRIQTISNKRDSAGAEEHSFSVDASNKLNISLFNAIGSAVGATSLTTGVWYHLAGVRSGSNMYVFVNGVLDGSGVATGSAATNTGVLHIGRDGFNTARDFNGWLDEFRFTKGVARYTATFTPPTEPYPNY